ncbi:MAG: glycerophosphoryl diester phosphodiesterase membrane domain-containing protein [Bacteroidales bacterium]|nr:glycerophosphoryl diester phosphodiesterase membrane domain-containing protein [Bacteroidales bacterium]
MKKLQIGDTVSLAWDLAVKHWPIFVLFSIITSLLSQGIVTVDSDALLASMDGDPEAMMEAYASAIKFSPILGTICCLLAIYLSYVVYNLYVRAYCEGKPYESFAGIFKCDINQLAIYFFAELAYGIIVGLGTLLFILPGIYFGIRLWYVPLLTATQKVGFADAFRQSWEMTKGNFWELLLMGITMIGIAIVGLAACCVGAFFADVIVNFMLVVSFFFLMPQAPETSFDEDPLNATEDFVEVQ